MLAGWQCSACPATLLRRKLLASLPHRGAYCAAACLHARLQFSTALFVPHRQGGRQQQGGASGQQPGAGQGLARPGSAAAAAATYNGLLQRGQPLPDRGTCKHYRQAVTHVPGDAMASSTHALQSCAMHARRQKRSAPLPHSLPRPLPRSGTATAGCDSPAAAAASRVTCATRRIQMGTR